MNLINEVDIRSGCEYTAIITIYDTTTVRIYVDNVLVEFLKSGRDCYRDNGYKIKICRDSLTVTLSNYSGNCNTSTRFHKGILSIFERIVHIHEKLAVLKSQNRLTESEIREIDASTMNVLTQ